MPRKNEVGVVSRNDAEDASLDAAQEMVRELTSRGEVGSAIEVIETMEESRPQSQRRESREENQA
ncbi:MAG: hypothetical protein ABL984_12460 [Pyrinomonadaceae bacterium]